MGAVFNGKGAPPRARYTMRLRRAVPALALLLVLAAVAGFTWMQVLDRVEARTDAATTCTTTVRDPNKVQLRVYNGTAREGLARTVAVQLADRGFQIMATENDPLADVRPVDGTAEVRYGPKGAKFAEQVRRQVPGATLYRDVREGAEVDLVIGAAYKRLSTPAELTRGRQGLAAPAPAKTTTAASPAPSPSPTC